MAKKLYLILHDIRSVENVGSIFRTADAAGVEKIYLTGYTPAPIDRFGRKRKDLAKVALGAEETVEWEPFSDIQKLIKKIKNSKTMGTIVALEQSKNSINYKKVKKTMGTIVLIVGNEVEGIPNNILKICDQIIEIPMHGKKESLNVAVATGIMLFSLLDY
jgi:tRNA G18 (ribose-2'-O)-methylase SpoU